MKKKSLFKIAMLMVISAMAVGVSLTYVFQGAYSYGRTGISTKTHNLSGQDALEATFLKQYDISNRTSEISNYTSVYTAYGDPAANTVIINCRYGIYPVGNTPLPIVSSNATNASAVIDYATRDEFILTLCGIYNYSRCGYAANNLSSIILDESAYNSTAIARIFNTARLEVDSYYNLSISSGGLSPFIYPILHDFSIINSTKNSPSCCPS